MNLRLIFCIGMGLGTTYLGIFMLMRQFNDQPRKAPPPKPNFSAQSATVIDPNTGEKTTIREITVSTKFVPGAATPTPEPLR